MDGRFLNLVSCRGFRAGLRRRALIVFVDGGGIGESGRSK